MAIADSPQIHGVADAAQAKLERALSAIESGHSRTTEA